MKTIETLNNVRMVLNDDGNFVIAYGQYYGSTAVAKYIEYRDLPDALKLLKKYYKNPDEPRYLDNAMENFYTVAKELVNIVYTGDENVWLWLKKQKKLVAECKEFFIRAATEQQHLFPFSQDDDFKQIFSWFTSDKQKKASA